MKITASIIALILFTVSLNAMKFSNASAQSITPEGKNDILKIIDLRISQMNEVKECVSNAQSENDIAKCRITNARTKHTMKQKITQIKNKTIGTTSF